MSDTETRKCPCIASSPRDQTAPATLFWSWCKFLHWPPAIFSFLQGVKWLRKHWCFHDAKEGMVKSPPMCPSSSGMVLIRSNPLAAQCQIPCVPHQPTTKSISLLFPSHCALTWGWSAVTSLKSWSLFAGVTRITSEKMLRMFSCPGYASNTSLVKRSSPRLCVK